MFIKMCIKEVLTFAVVAIGISAALPYGGPLGAIFDITKSIAQIPLKTAEGAIEGSVNSSADAAKVITSPVSTATKVPKMLITKEASNLLIGVVASMLPAPLQIPFAIFIKFLIAVFNAYQGLS